MALLSVAVLDQLANQYAQALSRIQIAAETAAVDAWYAHNSFDSDDDDEWEATFWALLAAAALAVETLTAAYYQAQRDYLGIAPRVAVPDVVDTLAADFAQYGISPAVRARFLISEGLEGTDAITDAATRVSKLASTATRSVEQLAFSEMMSRLDFETVWEFEVERPDDYYFPETDADATALATQAQAQGYPMSKKGKGSLRWRRVPQGGACGWCQAQSRRLLTDETHDRGAGWHTFCRCGWRMVTPTEAQTWEPISSEEFNTLIGQRAVTE